MKNQEHKQLYKPEKKQESPSFRPQSSSSQALMAMGRPTAPGRTIHLLGCLRIRRSILRSKLVRVRQVDHLHQTLALLTTESSQLQGVMEKSTAQSHTLYPESPFVPRILQSVVQFRGKQHHAHRQRSDCHC